jgi:nitroreductase
VSKGKFIPLSGYIELPPAEMMRRSELFYREMDRRRTVREFDSRTVPGEVVENCIRAAGTAPSGANLQPWKFVVVSDPEMRRRIRVGAEEEEREFYNHRAPKEWLEALEPLGTDHEKPFLETAPTLIAVFGEMYGTGEDGTRRKHYYTVESVGLATGLLIAAVHQAGLVSLTHTPSPMKFLNTILGRPDNERPFLLLVVGYPAKGVQVPDIQRKSLKEIAEFV